MANAGVVCFILVLVVLVGPLFSSLGLSQSIRQSEINKGMKKHGGKREKMEKEKSGRIK